MVIDAAQNGQTTNYTYGLERISAITGSTRTEYVYDGRGSVAAEVSYNNAWYTFGGGLAKKNVTSKSYTPFGEQIGEAVSGFGYNGEYYNAATGMIYLRARFYEPEMSRFSQKDTLRGSIIDGISLNRYLYCQSDPVNYKDSDGRRMVNVNVADGGGSFRSSQTYKNYLAEGQRLVNEAQQAVRQAEAAWHEAEAYAPGSQAARDAMNAWKQAKSAASRASSNLSSLRSVSSLSAANSSIANIRSAASSARNAASTALTCADRAARKRTGSSVNGTSTNSPSVSAATRDTEYDCGVHINALGAGDYEGIGETLQAFVSDIKKAYNSVKDFITSFEQIDNAHYRVKIDTTGKLVMYSVARVGEIAIDCAEIVGSCVAVATAFASAPETLGATLIIVDTFFAALSTASISLAADIASTAQDYSEYRRNGEIYLEINLLPKSSSFADYFLWILGLEQ